MKIAFFFQTNLHVETLIIFNTKVLQTNTLSLKINIMEYLSDYFLVIEYFYNCIILNYFQNQNKYFINMK